MITTLPPEIARLVSLLNVTAPTADWRVLVFLVAGAIVSTVFFGLAPALQSTRLDLVRTMRGEVTRDARPSRARHALIAVQVGAAALLLICAAIFLRGAVAAATKVAGVRTIDTVMVNIDDESKRGALLQSLQADSLVVDAHRFVFVVARRRRNGCISQEVWVDQMAVSSDYFDVVGWDLVSGGPSHSRNGRRKRASRSYPRRRAPVWPNGDAVGSRSGSRLRNRRRTPNGGLTAHADGRRRRPRSGASFRMGFPASTFRPDSKATGRRSCCASAATRAGAQRAARSLTGLDPAFGVMTLRTVTGMQTYMLRIAFCVTVVLGGLALMLTVSGLFSVLSYLVEQQTKEIGVRMALGAAAKHVAQSDPVSVAPAGWHRPGRRRWPGRGGGDRPDSTPVAAEIGGSSMCSIPSRTQQAC